MLWLQTSINLVHGLIKILFLVKYMMDRVLHINKETVTDHNQSPGKFSGNCRLLTDSAKVRKTI